MANTFNKRIWELDSLGIISAGPIHVHGVMFYPNAQADAAQFLWWDEDSPAITVKGVTYTVTTATDNTVTSTGNLTNAWADGKVAKCLISTGVNATKYGLIKTAGNNDAFVTHLAPFTNEADKVGDWVCYNTYNAIKLKQPFDTNELSMYIPIDFTFPNLALDSASASTTITLYVG